MNNYIYFFTSAIVFINKIINVYYWRKLRVQDFGIKYNSQNKNDKLHTKILFASAIVYKQYVDCKL